MNLMVSGHADRPIYEQLEEQIRTLILKKKLMPDDQLPSVRTLSKDLNIGIITVKRAYDDLVDEGFLISHPGKGYFVRDVDLKRFQAIYMKRIKASIKEILKLKEESQIDDETIEQLWRHKGEDHL